MDGVKLRYRSLGRTGIAISELSLGVSNVAPSGQNVVTRGVRTAVDAGINYFDTAPLYSDGLDEEALGIALQGIRHNVFLATKVGYTPRAMDHRSVDGLMQQLDASLRRLRADHVDTVQIHEADFRKWWTGKELTEEEGKNPRGQVIRDDESYDFSGAPVIEFLSKAQKAGKARFVGITAKDARQAARLVTVLDFDTVMIAHQLNPILRNASAYLLPVAAKRNVGVLVAAPLMQGLLARPKHKWREAPPDWMDPTFFKAYFALIDLSDRVGIGVQELAFRWLAAQDWVGSVVFGFRSSEDIASNAESVHRGPLSVDIMSELDAIGIVHPLVFQGRTTL